jgi:hypothetical protein
MCFISDNFYAFQRQALEPGSLLKSIKLVLMGRGVLFLGGGAQ